MRKQNSSHKQWDTSMKSVVTFYCPDCLVANLHSQETKVDRYGRKIIARRCTVCGKETTLVKDDK